MASVHLGKAIFTLDKKLVALNVGAVAVRIGFVVAAVAVAYNIIRNALAKAVVKHKIFADEFCFKILLADFMSVLNNPSVKLIHIREPNMLQVSACFFAAYTARAVQNNF